MNLKYILIGVIVLIILGAAIFWFQSFQTPQVEQEQEQPQVTEEKESEILKEKEYPVLEMILGSPEKKVAPLTAADGSNSVGAAYLLRKEGKLYLTVMADMPDPGEGNVYEGWLVQPSPLQFFPTGVMEKTEEGVWILEYTAGEEYPSYTRVVITEETVVDETPETHIIEGSF